MSYMRDADSRRLDSISVPSRDEVDTAIAQAVTDLLGGAPGALDTLNELAAALGDDASFAATVATALSTLTTAVSSEITAREADVDAEESARIAADATNAAAITAEAALARDASNLTGGTIPDARIPSSITRDSELSAAVDAAIAALVGGAPGALDTLKELADAINDDASFASTVTTALAGKASATDLTTETTNRTNADSSEAATRAAADTANANAISAEATTRANADTTLQTNITAEATARANADTSEASTRAAADTALSTRVTAVEAFTQAGVELASAEVAYAFNTACAVSPATANAIIGSQIIVPPTTGPVLLDYGGSATVGTSGGGLIQLQLWYQGDFSVPHFASYGVVTAHITASSGSFLTISGRFRIPASATQRIYYLAAQLYRDSGSSLTANIISTVTNPTYLRAVAL